MFRANVVLLFQTIDVTLTKLQFLMLEAKKLHLENWEKILERHGACNPKIKSSTPI